MKRVPVRLGLETCDALEQACDGGKVDGGAFAWAVRALFAAGFSAREVAACVLAGRPGQGIEGVRATVEFARRLGVPVHLAQFLPIPGTVEWAAAVEAGLIAADPDPLLHNNSIYPCADARALAALTVQVRAANQALLREAR